MQLRKNLILGAAVLTAGVLGLTSTADATGGGAITYIGVNGSTATGSVAINGIFRGGTATFAGSSYSCTSGTVSGTVTRGPASATKDLSFPTLSLSCNTPLGAATISVNPSCAVTAEFADADVHDGTRDTGTGAAFSRVDGPAPTYGATFPGVCVKLTAVFGACTANVVGTVDASFDEAITTTGGVKYQDLILNGSGTLANQSSGCTGVMTGSFTLNDIDFGIQVTGGTTSGIDFRQRTGGPIDKVWVNGATTAGTDPINGSFKSGNATFFGSTYGCTSGTVSGTVSRGPRPLGAGVHDLSFPTLALSCATPVGPATISVNAGCAVTADFVDFNVNDGNVDTGAGANYDRVQGLVASGTGTCVKLSALFGACTAYVNGTLNASFDEAVATFLGVNYQDLILSGSGTIVNQSAGCAGMLTGVFTLNNIDFGIEVTGGTTTGIDFRP